MNHDPIKKIIVDNWRVMTHDSQIISQKTKSHELLDPPSSKDSNPNYHATTATITTTSMKDQLES
jgi:hypothetical protein